jgi:hypothetical protein
MGKLIKKVTQIEYHRNGVCGDPFYAVLFTDSEKRNMLGVVFDAPMSVAVFEVGLLNDPKIGVTFGHNSWRGDHYEPELRSAIRKYEKED